MRQYAENNSSDNANSITKVIDKWLTLKGNDDTIIISFK